jgi:hypothetical protein
MGEYVKHSKHGEIKIGTCENLYCTRFEQMKNDLSLLSKLEGNDYPDSYVENNSGYRFRFPFPDEDEINMGSYQDSDKHLTVMVPRKFWDQVSGENHERKCLSFSDNGSHNINVMVPCPYSPEFKTAHSSFNQTNGFFPSSGYSIESYGLVGIVQQKFVDNELQVVLVCPYCGIRYRVDRSGAAFLVRSIRMFHYRKDDGNYSFWRKVCERIIKGYQMKKQFNPVEI